MPVSPITLARCPLFRNAAAESLAFAAERSGLVELRRREALVAFDGRFEGFGVVIQGGLSATDLTPDGREAALLSAEAPDAFGLAQVLAMHPCELSWMASVAPTTVAVMSLGDARQLMARPEMALSASQLLAQQACDLLQWQRLQAIHPVTTRIVVFLAQRWRQHGEVWALPTHGELALRLGTTRESVTRMMQRLQADGVMKRDGDVWQVLQGQALLELSRRDGRS